jgi:hydroxyacylglutathione hydrolase
MQIYRLPVLTDNYIFVLHDSQQGVAAVVDPAESQPVLDCLTKINADLVAIFNTHHHSDHVGGNRELINHYPQVCVYGGAEDRGRIPGQQVFLQDGDEVKFSDRTANIFFVPGHTKAHIAYYFPPVDNEGIGDLFCGDTLFAGGCGRLFEGTPALMVDSLSKIRNLPDSTRIWCAHEYTLGNLKFAVTIDEHNLDLQKRYAEVQTARSEDQPTIPSLLGVEKRTNPFLRWDNPQIQAQVKTQDDVETFRKIRGMKDLF